MYLSNIFHKKIKGRDWLCKLLVDILDFLFSLDMPEIGNTRSLVTDVAGIARIS